MKRSPVRQFLLGFGGMVVAIVAIWLIPSAMGHGMHSLLAQAAPVAAQTPVVAPPPTAVPAPPAAAVSLFARLTGFIGIALILLLGYLMSHNRAAIRWRTVAWGLGLQFLFAIFVLRVPFGQDLFRHLGDFITAVLHYSYVGSEFVFGELGKPDSKLGVIFAFQLLPAIIFISALFAILYYLGVMQIVVRACAVVMTKLLGASGAESLNVGASIFMGQTEAPLTIRPFLDRMTQSELMTVMTAGMAHVSGSIMAAYIAFGVDARHLLSAVIMTAPGTIMMAKMFEPETEVPETSGTVKIDIPKHDVNLLDAAARGTSEGLGLMLNVIAMLIAFVALIALVNGGMGWVHGVASWFPADMQTVFAWVGRPVAWALGVPWKDSGAIGGLLGTRAVLNEFIAFSQLGPMKGTIDPRSFTIASFALAGFANFSSVGIQIGGIGALVPNRKSDLARLGLRAMLAGTLANFLSAAIAGILL
ncbi:MAG TPA: nucleoside transporter C-terminal domain-containing protein [Gemmatimonadales bacterium]|jgi:CNT family concentrative nucleoside transporter|nr:nucleoside transporter C-terminal domain-containing protein [Gemmatimonadales bacterium]